MSWKDLVTAHCAHFLSRRDFPVAAKDLAWRLILFAVRCGRSHPISFALRPVLFNKHFKTAIGVGLSALAIFMPLYGPLPGFAGDGIGGPIELNVRSEGEISLATVEAVQIPIANYRFSQGFNWYHPGVDLAAPKGTLVYPVMAGVVTEAETSRWGYGNNVVIVHANGYWSRYAHLSVISVKKDQTVNLNSEIGQVGSTGRSSGPHLHLEIYSGDSPVNPKILLDIK